VRTRYSKKDLDELLEKLLGNHVSLIDPGSDAYYLVWGDEPTALAYVNRKVINSEEARALGGLWIIPQSLFND